MPVRMVPNPDEVSRQLRAGRPPNTKAEITLLTPAKDAVHLISLYKYAAS